MRSTRTKIAVRVAIFVVIIADIDSHRLAFFGVSWGGRMAPIMLGIEHRFKAAVVTIAGLRHQTAQPEADPSTICRE